VGLEENHDDPDFLLLVPGFLNHPDALFADAFDICKPFNIAFNDVQGFFLELLHNALGHDRTDALDQP